MKTSAEFRKACPYAWMLVKRAASWPMLPELRPFPEDVSGLMGTGSGAMPDTPAAPAAAPVLVRPFSPWINPDGTPYGTRGPSGQKPQPAQAQDPRPEQQAQAQGIKTDPRKLQSGTRAYSDTGYGIMDRPPKMMTPGLWTPGKLTAPRPAGAPAR